MIRRNRMRKTSRQPPAARIGRELTSLINGNRINVPSDPPSTDNNPWNQIVLKLATANSASLAVVGPSTIITALITQLAGPAAIALQYFLIRIKSVRYWGSFAVSGLSNENTIALTPYSLLYSGNTTYPIRTINDEPGGVTRASAGYTWPMAHQSVCFNSNDTNTIFAIADGSAGGFGLAHVHIMYRFTQQLDPV